MVEHSLRSKESKHGGQVLILLSWLFQDEFIFQSLMRDLVNIISRKEDRYIALGWCTLVRELVEYESTMTQYSLSGLREKYSAMIEILCTCISHLSAIVSRGSTVSDGYELPSRLSISAADCCLAITEALTRKDDSLKNKIRISDFNTSKEAVPSLPGIGEKKAKETQTISNRGRETLLWDQLPELINLVQRLLAWSRKSRPLHARGLERVLKWLQDLNEHNGRLREEADMEILKARELLLSSCWKHYSVLLHLEELNFSQNCRERLEQYLSGIQLYAERSSYNPSKHKDGAAETRNFFLNCLCLLLGRLVGRRFESVMSEYGLQISEVLISQLNSGDEDVIDLVVGIFKGTIFKLNYSSEGILIDTRQMDAVLPLLLQLLDKRDGTARAVVILVAEYCSMSIDGECLKEVLERLACGNNLQQRNALDVISEIIQISLTSADGLPHLAWRDISNYLLGCLESGEPAICRAATNLLPMIEPSYVLPALVRLLYSSDIELQLSVKDAFIGVLKYHNQEPEVISMLLDSLSNLSNSLDFPKTSGITVEGSKFDADKVLKLMTEWSENVQDWKIMAGPLIDKLFTEPSNAIVVKFLSYISEHLADAADIILNRVLKCMQEQEELVSETSPHEDSEMQKCLFERLCPLLIIRLLPLRVFNSLNSSIVYGQLHNKDINHDGTSTIHDNCVTALLLKRAFSKFEFEDVRKLAAELSGRILPTVLFPLVCFQLEDSAGIRDVSRIKAGLFSLCTSLVVRGRNITVTSTMIRIRKLLEEILSWPSLDGDEVSRAQHGCIDCLALMICTEVQSSSGSFGDSNTLKKKITLAAAEGMTDLESTLSYVISQLDNDDSSSTSFEAPLSLSFRLCMANVLISACQKIADSGKTHLARKTIPALIRSSEVIKDREIRAACLQVLFSAVYHLKSAVIPYSSDLIKLSLKFLREGSEKERMAGAKLLAALMASEDPILESISAGLLDARSILSTLSRTDPLPELRQACQKLLLCLTSS
ncbi:uncharacterized protein LOC116207678 [Punica granatum]|uniref:Uncharacterized protein LOC116207678 n=1 Tax=Punica granatum TaxID=22663 RepID=A0A6P8DJR2_PUNGR|nr:uncharacterized protein LOC116207678 [Punica granatum]XP_031396596.1 uncharacterized protein LOC116207678 [Punica granatum]